MKGIKKKDLFICGYVNGAMKNHNLPESMEYYRLLEKTEKEALKCWKKVKKFEKSLIIK
jgi:hypothetical protein